MGTKKCQLNECHSSLTRMFTGITLFILATSNLIIYAGIYKRKKGGKRGRERERRGEEDELHVAHEGGKKKKKKSRPSYMKHRRPVILPTHLKVYFYQRRL